MILNKLKSNLLLSFATTCAFAGTSLIGMCLVLDMWRMREMTKDEGGKMIEYLQGITHECARVNRSMDCYSWKRSLSSNKLIQLRELLLVMTMGAVLCGLISLFMSLTATVSRLPKFVVAVTAFELASGLLGMTVIGLYAMSFLKEPWQPAASFHCLIGGTVCTFVALTIHIIVGDVKFFVPTKNKYRYNKGTSTLDIP